ncbi:MAG: DUF2306 domain-containing protein [Proteobacteria bacterium]|nr:DUF2306 domain-containing protein [Pseudomonadota bacterium]
MDYQQLLYLHLLTVLPAAIIGMFIFFLRKGTHRHKTLGKIYLLLMFLTTILTLLMPARIGPLLFSHFGFLHLLSLLVLIFVWRGYFAARNGAWRQHKHIMISLYIGAILIAGTAALFSSERFLHSFLFA